MISIKYKTSMLNLVNLSKSAFEIEWTKHGSMLNSKVTPG